MVSALSPFNSTNLAKHASTSISSRASNTLPLSPPGKVTRGSTDQSAIVFLESPASRSAFPKASVSDDAPSQLLQVASFEHILFVFVSCWGNETPKILQICITWFHSPFLCKTLERRGRGMHSIVSLVGDRCEAKILVAANTKQAINRIMRGVLINIDKNHTNINIILTKTTPTSIYVNYQFTVPILTYQG